MQTNVDTSTEDQSPAGHDAGHLALDAVIPRTTFFRKVTLASAGVFALVAAKGSGTADAHPGQGNFGCCGLARPDQWCAPLNGGTDFWCDHGGFKRVWNCCSGNRVAMCGECQSSTSICEQGGTYYCSYGAWIPGSC